MAAKEFGESLKKHRSGKHTQTELGKILGVGLKQIQRYENGEVLPDHGMVQRLCDLYKYDFVRDIYDLPPPANNAEDKYLTLMRERVAELSDDKAWLKRNLETSLKSILEGQHQNGVQLKALSWYSALVASGGDPKKADQEVLKIHNRIASYEGVKGEDDSSSEGGKRRTSVKK